MKNINKITLLSSLLLSSSALFAVAPPPVLMTSTGFAYPANMKHAASPYYGFGDKVSELGGLCHLANDYKLAEGMPVYATADGVVEQLDTNFPFYGSSSGAPGGVMVIKHVTSGGEIFYSTYGHIKLMAVAVGDFVKTGDHIARVGRYISGGNNLPHLHFAINTEKSSYNPYSPTTACVDNRGFVDPEIFMLDHYTAKESCRAVDNEVSTPKNVIVNIPNVLFNDTDVDGDPLVLLSADSTSIQGVSIANHGDGTFTYTPALDYKGADSFNYKISDNLGCTKQATVFINVTDPSSGGGNGGSGSGGGSFNPLAIAGLLLLLFTRRFRKKGVISS
ncbi:MAG TPA: M23 family metallopeptidase [Leucothrix mucor]|nr:M23 family metallopeptidase [Leucothrix mucor]